jgi:hypothetical protein
MAETHDPTKAAAPTAPARSSRTRAVKKQTFVVSHLREAEFLAGLRPYADYRDLGIAKATDGLAQAHVIRFKPPFEPEEASTPHYHVVDFQMAGTGLGLKARAPIRSKREAVGYSRLGSSTPCSDIPTTANCLRSCCRPISRR